MRLLTTQIDDTKVKTIIIGAAYLERTKSEKSNRFLCNIGAKGKVLLTFFTQRIELLKVWFSLGCSPRHPRGRGYEPFRPTWTGLRQREFLPP